MINYDYLVEKAITNNEIIQLLCGKNEYKIEVSKYTSDVFPTDINAVLVNCFYKQMDKNVDIAEIFMKNLQELLHRGACETYIAILYFDACVFQEERKKARFIIDKYKLASNIRDAVAVNKKELQDFIVFDNGIQKKNPWKNIENFNNYYQKKYKVSII